MEADPHAVRSRSGRTGRGLHSADRCSAAAHPFRRRSTLRRRSRRERESDCRKEPIGRVADCPRSSAREMVCADSRTEPRRPPPATSTTRFRSTTITPSGAGSPPNRILPACVGPITDSRRSAIGPSVRSVKVVSNGSIPPASHDHASARTVRRSGDAAGPDGRTRRPAHGSTHRCPYPRAPQLLDSRRRPRLSTRQPDPRTPSSTARPAHILSGWGPSTTTAPRRSETRKHPSRERAIDVEGPPGSLPDNSPTATEQSVVSGGPREDVRPRGRCRDTEHPRPAAAGHRSRRGHDGSGRTEFRIRGRRDPGGPLLPPRHPDSRDARIVYLYGEREIARANDTQRAIGVPAEVRSRVLFEMRNALRTYTESSCPTGSPHWVSRSPTPT